MQTLHALQHVQALRRRPDAHKGDAGKVLLVGGAASMAGALVLSGLGALYSGAGWTQLMMLDTKSAHLVPTQPELMVHQAQDWEPQQALEHIRPDVVAIGPGLGQSTQAQMWLQAALQWRGPLVLDADALNLWEAAGLGVQLHASAGDQLLSKGVGPIGMTPRELALEIRTLLNEQL